MINIRTKQRPDLDQWLYHSIGLRSKPSQGVFKNYEWLHREGDSSVKLGDVHVISNPASVSHSFYIGLETPDEAIAKRGRGLPEDFADYLRTHRAMIPADQRFLAFLTAYPELERMLTAPDASMLAPEAEPVHENQLASLYSLCQLTRFAEGRPTYGIQLSTVCPHPAAVKDAALALGVHLATAFDGILFNHVTNQVGKPKPRSAQTYSSVRIFELLSELAPQPEWTSATQSPL